MQKIYVKAKNTKEMLAMLNISKKNSKQNENYFILGILLGITIGSIAAETAAADTIAITTPLYLPTGGEVKLVPAAALTADASFILVVEYIETELTDGTYTD